MRKFSEILNSELCVKIQNEINNIPRREYQDNNEILRWEQLLFQAKNRNPNEIVLILEEDDRFVVDNKSITDSRNSIKMLDSILSNSKRNMYDIYEAFWVELMHKSNYFHLFHRVASTFLAKINKSRIEDSIQSGASYNDENGIELLISNLESLKEGNNYFDFWVHMLIDNHKTNQTTFCDFGFGPRGVNIKVGDEKYLDLDFFELEINKLNTLGKDISKMNEVADSFIKFFDYYLPLGDGPFNLNRDFIHVIKVNFAFTNPKTIYLEGFQYPKNSA